MALPPWFLFIFITFSSSILLFKLISRVFRRKPNLPPSPPSLPIIGNLHQLTSPFHRTLSNLSKQHGPVMLLHKGSVPLLVVSSAEMARKVLVEQSMAFSNRVPSTRAAIIFSGRTAISFAPYGEDWRKMRNACISGLLTLRKVQSLKPAREEEVAAMIESISRSCSQRGTVNLSHTLLDFSYNIISKCVTGRDSKREDVKRFGELLKALFIQVLPESFFFGDFFPWLGWLDTVTGSRGKLEKFSRDLDNYVDEVIDEHLIRKTKPDDPDYQKDFVDHLLQVQQDNHFTHDNVKTIITEMYFAGTDMIAFTIEWAMSELAENQNVMKKAQEEVRGVVGTKSKVDEDDIQHMSYLKCVLKETLRLHPSSALFPLECSMSTSLNGYHVPANTRVLINVWDIQRDTRLWDRPDEFIPERFIDNPVDFKGQDYEFIPFGSGRRGCPGTLFGMTVIELAMANLLYRFDWELPEGVKAIDMEENMGVLHAETRSQVQGVVSVVKLGM